MYYKHIHTGERVYKEDAPAYFLHELFTNDDIAKEHNKDFPLYCFGDEQYTDEDVALQWYALLTDKEARAQWLKDYTEWYFSGPWIEVEEEEESKWIRIIP